MAQAEADALIVNLGWLDQVGSQNAVALAVLGGGLTLLGGMALVLSLVSLYALTSFTLTRRTREIGIRLVLGGTERSIARAILGRAALSIVTGATAGAVLSGLLLQLRAIFVFRVPSGEPWLLPLIALAMSLAGIVASWVPTRRALAVPPAEIAPRGVRFSSPVRRGARPCSRPRAPAPSCWAGSQRESSETPSKETRITDDGCCVHRGTTEMPRR